MLLASSVVLRRRLNVHNRFPSVQTTKKKNFFQIDCPLWYRYVWFFFFYGKNHVYVLELFSTCREQQIKPHTAINTNFHYRFNSAFNVTRKVAKYKMYSHNILIWSHVLPCMLFIIFRVYNVIVERTVEVWTFKYHTRGKSWKNPSLREARNTRGYFAKLNR